MDNQKLIEEPNTKNPKNVKKKKNKTKKIIKKTNNIMTNFSNIFRLQV